MGIMLTSFSPNSWSSGDDKELEFFLTLTSGSGVGKNSGSEGSPRTRDLPVMLWTRDRSWQVDGRETSFFESGWEKQFECIWPQIGTGCHMRGGRRLSGRPYRCELSGATARRKHPSSSSITPPPLGHGFAKCQYFLLLKNVKSNRGVIAWNWIGHRIATSESLTWHWGGMTHNIYQ